jgi:hypothetical protein
MKGNYANNMFASHTKEEFILDFINIAFFPPPGQGVAVSRVITSPGHFKRMIAALNENLKKYEEQFGKIEGQNSPAAPQPTSTSNQTFGFDSK